jgi:hypothetical protein
MLEIADYRASERLARSVIGSWLTAQTHDVDHFARSGFPVRIESRHETGQLLDTMQENRFELFMRELNGLTASDATLLTDALAESVRFQMATLPKRRPIIPLSTMISSLTLYRKILGCKDRVESVLEVGPGCGYLAFFLANAPALRDYSQVEACESFYILQSLINAHLFRHRYCDFAIRAGVDLSLNVRRDVDDTPIVLDAELPPQACFHYPWWTLGMLYGSGPRYDVVTSNANLNEFSENALREYLAIFLRVLKDDGLFVVQCTGFPAHGTLEQLFDKLHAAGFAPLFCGLAAENVDPAVTLSTTYRDMGFGERPFALNNLIMVKQGHPLFEACNRREAYAHGHAAAFNRLATIYDGSGARTRYSRQELVQAVKQRLRAV